MRQNIGWVVSLLTVAALAGCASTPSSSSQARSSSDVMTAMNTELAHTVDQFPASVGTTTVTSATVDPSTLPDARGTVKQLQVEPLPEPSAPSIPSSGN